MIIAIDGPSGAGKGTVAAYLAAKFNLHKLDTGLFYRALASLMIEQNISPTEVEKIITLAEYITLEDTNRPGLRTEVVAALASKIAVIPQVREIMNRHQRDFAQKKHEGYDGVILDGRDIGTVICPDADIKIFLTASQEVRALRRAKEEAVGCHKALTKMMEERDQRDFSRESAPLNAAKDAIIIDTSHLSIDELCEKAAYYIENLIASKK